VAIENPDPRPNTEVVVEAIGLLENRARLQERVTIISRAVNALSNALAENQNPGLEVRILTCIFDLLLEIARLREEFEIEVNLA
jgi:hypothetical protein